MIFSFKKNEKGIKRGCDEILSENASTKKIIKKREEIMNMKINIRYEISIQQTGAVRRGEYHRRGRLLGGGLPKR